ncbi:MAG: OsmC family peroxiredoxin [Chitinophagaceae bacterium]|nr:MAG: OsmC family peroxiredoxin [Chitinophagaceae bacterium]
MPRIITVTTGGADYLCHVSDGEHEWTIDEPLEAGGGNTAHDPYGALLASLGSCSAITLCMYARRKGWNVSGVTVQLSLQRQDTGAEKSTLIRRSLGIRGDLDDTQRARLAQIVAACPVSRILEGSIRIETVDHS